MFGKRVIKSGLGHGFFGGMSKRAWRKVPVGQRVIDTTAREVFRPPVARRALPAAPRVTARAMPQHRMGLELYRGGVPAKVAQEARKGKMTSKLVIGAAVGIPILSAYRNRSGPAADKGRGRPTGMYMY